MFIKFLINEMTRLLIFDKNFFSKSCTSKLGVRLICECGLYAGVYGKSLYEKCNKYALIAINAK